MLKPCKNSWQKTLQKTWRLRKMHISFQLLKITTVEPPYWRDSGRLWYLYLTCRLLEQDVSFSQLEEITNMGKLLDLYCPFQNTPVTWSPAWRSKSTWKRCLLQKLDYILGKEKNLKIPSFIQLALSVMVSLMARKLIFFSSWLLYQRSNTVPWRVPPAEKAAENLIKWK